MFKSIITVLLISSIGFVKPSEEDLVGLWKAAKVQFSSEIKDLSGANISMQCSVEGKLGKFSGNTNKNFFSGLYNVKSKNEISIDGFISSNFKDSEEAKSFIETIKKIDHFIIENESLIFLNKTDDTKLIFSRMD